MTPLRKLDASASVLGAFRRQQPTKWVEWGLLAELGNPPRGLRPLPIKLWRNARREAPNLGCVKESFTYPVAVLTDAHVFAVVAFTLTLLPDTVVVFALLTEEAHAP